MERYVKVLASRLGRGCDVTLCALAEALPQTSGQLQVNLLKLGKNNDSKILSISLSIIIYYYTVYTKLGIL